MQWNTLTYVDVVKCNAVEHGPWVTLGVTQPQNMDYKNECQLCHGSKHPRTRASKIHSTEALWYCEWYISSVAGAGFAIGRAFDEIQVGWDGQEEQQCSMFLAQLKEASSAMVWHHHVKWRGSCPISRSQTWCTRTWGQATRKNARAGIPMILQSAMLSYLGRDIIWFKKPLYVCWLLIAVISQGSSNNVVYSQYITHWLRKE